MIPVEQTVVLIQTAEECAAHYASVGKNLGAISPERSTGMDFVCGKMMMRSDPHLHVLSPKGKWWGVCSEQCAMRLIQEDSTDIRPRLS